MSRLRKKSAWTFDTSASTGLGGSFKSGLNVSGTKGVIYLKDPSESRVAFHYVSAGPGLGWGIKTKLGANISTEEMLNVGQIWLLYSFHGQDLTSDDIEGFSITTEISGFASLGASAAAIYLGIPFRELPLQGLNRSAVGGVFELLVSAGPTAP